MKHKSSMMSSNKRGGPGRGQGRKPVADGRETVTVSLRMTPEQRETLRALGGAGWVRKQIDNSDILRDKSPQSDTVSGGLASDSDHSKAA